MSIMKQFALVVATLTSLGMSQVAFAASIGQGVGQDPSWSGLHKQGSQAACASWRWIAKAKKAGDECRRVPRWRQRSLYDLPKQSKQYRSPLGSYCVYEAESVDSSVGELKKYLGQSYELAQDCFVALNMATNLAEDQKPYLEKFLDKQTDFIGIPKSEMAEGNSVRLALLDTSPDYDGFKSHAWDLPPHERPSLSDHGYSLANIMNRLTCGDQYRCPINLVSALALPVYRFNSEDPNQTESYPFWGGYFGSIAHVGEAVMRAVTDWQNQGNPDQRMVINISAGWDAKRFGGLYPLQKPMPLIVQSTFEALRYAACHGALIIAANGNDMGGLDPAEGALAPGLWEQVPMPEEKECLTLTGGRLSGPGAENADSDYTPMLYGISGVSYGRKALDNARKGSGSRLAAYGDHATVVKPKGVFGWPAATMTGSSVSAALVSATAAKVWSYRPKRSAHEVMEILYESAYSLGRLAETCLGGDDSLPCPKRYKARRLSYCGAVNKACEDCEPMTCSAAINEPIDLSGMPLGGFGDPSVPVIDASTINQLAPTGTLCEARNVYYDPSARPPAYWCPEMQLPGIADDGWSLPQPMKDQCPNCTIAEAEFPEGEIDFFGFGSSSSLMENNTWKNASSVSLSSQSLAYRTTKNQELPKLSQIGQVKQHAKSSEHILFLEIPNIAAYQQISNVTLNVNGEILHLNALSPLTRGQSAIVRGIHRELIKQAAITFLVNNRYAVTIPLLVADIEKTKRGER